MTQSTIDGEIEDLIATFIMQYDQRAKIGGRRNIKAVEKHKTAITNLIAQEANKAVLAEFTMLLAHPRITIGNLIPVSCVLDRIDALTADKEQAALQNKTNDGGQNGGL